MAWTRQHFKMLAAMIRDMPLLMRVEAAREHGKRMAAQNSRFNWDKWNEACGLGGSLPNDRTTTITKEAKTK